MICSFSFNQQEHMSGTNVELSFIDPDSGKVLDSVICDYGDTVASVFEKVREAHGDEDMFFVCNNFIIDEFMQDSLKCVVLPKGSQAEVVKIDDAFYLGLPQNDSVYRSITTIVESTKPKYNYSIGNTIDGCVNLFNDSLKVVGKSVLVKNQDTRKNTYSTRYKHVKSLDLRAPVGENINLIESNFVDQNNSIIDKTGELGRARKVFLAQTRENENLGFCFQSGSVSPCDPVIWPGRPGHSITGDLHRMSYVVSVKAPGEAMSVCTVPEPLESATMLGMRKCSSRELNRGSIDPLSVFDESNRYNVRLRSMVPSSGSVTKRKNTTAATTTMYENKRERRSHKRIERVETIKENNKNVATSVVNSPNSLESQSALSSLQTNNTFDKNVQNKEEMSEGKNNSAVQNTNTKDELMTGREADNNNIIKDKEDMEVGNETIVSNIPRKASVSATESEQISRRQTRAHSRMLSPEQSCEEDDDSSNISEEDENIVPFLISGPSKYRFGKSDDLVSYNGVASQPLIMDFWYLQSFVKFSTFDAPFCYEKTQINWDFNRQSIEKIYQNNNNIEITKDKTTNSDQVEFGQFNVEKNGNATYLLDSKDTQTTQNSTVDVNHSEMVKHYRDLITNILNNARTHNNLREQDEVINIISFSQNFQDPINEDAVKDIRKLCDFVQNNPNYARRISDNLVEALERGTVLLSKNFKFISSKPGLIIGQNITKDGRKIRNYTIRTSAEDPSPKPYSSTLNIHNIDGSRVFPGESLSTISISNVNPHEKKDLNNSTTATTTATTDKSSQKEEQNGTKSVKTYINVFNNAYYKHRINDKIVSMLNSPQRRDRCSCEDREQDRLVHCLKQFDGFGNLESYHFSDFVITPSALKLVPGDKMYAWLPYNYRNTSIFETSPRPTLVSDLRKINSPEIKKITLAAYDKSHIYNVTIVARSRNDYMELIRKLSDGKYIVSGSTNKENKNKIEKPQQKDDDCVNLINIHKIENISQQDDDKKPVINCPDVITQDISHIQECCEALKNNTETISPNVINKTSEYEEMSANNNNNKNNDVDNISKQSQKVANILNPLYVQQLKQQDQMARANILDFKRNMNIKSSLQTDIFDVDNENNIKTRTEQNSTQSSSQRSTSNEGKITNSFKIEKIYEDNDDETKEKGEEQEEHEVSEETGVTVKVALTRGTLASLMSALPRVLGDLGLPYRDPYGWTVIDKKTGVLISNPRTKSGSGDFRDPREVKLPRDILCIELLPTQNTLLNYNKAERQEEFLLSNNIQLPNGTTTLNKAFTFGDALPLDIDEMPMWAPDEKIAVLVSNATGKPHGSRCQIPTSSISTMNIFVTSLFNPMTIKRENV